MSCARASADSLWLRGLKAGLLIALELLLLLARPANSAETVRMGFLLGARRDSPVADVHTAFELWAEELSARFEVQMTVTYFDDIESMRQAFRRGEINGVGADAMLLGRNFKEDELADGYSVAMRGGWNLILLTGKESAIGVKDLLGKRVVLLENDQTSIIYLELLCHRHYARSCNRVFAEMQRVPSNNQAVLRLFFDKADVALVYSHGNELAKELNPQLEKRIGRVIGELPITSLYYAFFSASVSKDFRQRILTAIPTMHTYPRGRQLLDILKMDHLELAQPSELRPFTQMDKEYRQLKLQSERPKGRQ